MSRYAQEKAEAFLEQEWLGVDSVSLAALIDEVRMKSLAEGLAIEEIVRMIADEIEAPYPPEVFKPLTNEEITRAVQAMIDVMGPSISDRLHAQWARHIAAMVRKRAGIES